MKSKFIIPSNGIQLATYTVGSGAPVIFLHGGPGDTHHYMKRMAEPFTKDFQCIFFDQRGTGDSLVDRREPSQFRLELMLEDLHTVRKYYEFDSVSLVGHSWGAMYGLFACMNSPENFSKAALLNMGPLDAEMETQLSKRMASAFTTEEQYQWKILREKRNNARDSGDLKAVLEADKELMSLRVKTWIFDPQLHEAFLKDYFQDPPPDREVNKWVWESLEGWFSWEKVSQATSKIWLCAGENDSVPITQAQKLAGLLPQAKLSVYEKCGHIPWMEHSEKFYAELGAFLKDS